jgi:predicted DNA-binding WGR domain protein
MKRVFTLKDQESDKFWAIETNSENLIVNFGKVKNTTMALSNWDEREQQHKKDPVAVRLGEGGSVSEKAFASADLCGKEAEKLVAKKIKEGYAEQDSLFLDLVEGMQFFQDRSLDSFHMNRHKVGEPAPDPLDLGLPEKAALLRKALAELDKRESFTITYDVHLFIQYISIALEYKHLMNRHLIFDDMAQFFYRLPKFKAANEDIADGIKVLYASGLHMGKRDGIADLADFCAKHLDEGNAEEKKLIEAAAQERPIFYRIYVRLLTQKQSARAEVEKNRNERAPCGTGKAGYALCHQLWLGPFASFYRSNFYRPGKSCKSSLWRHRFYVPAAQTGRCGRTGKEQLVKHVWRRTTLRRS